MATETRAKTVYNFNPGPAILPCSVLERAQEELLSYQDSGMSILEVSHRAPAYEQVNDEAQARLRRLLQLGPDYDVLFLGGGASLQFAMVPMNFLPPGTTAEYIVTGSWTQKA